MEQINVYLQKVAENTDKPKSHNLATLAGVATGIGLGSKYVGRVGKTLGGGINNIHGRLAGVGKSPELKQKIRDSYTAGGKAVGKFAGNVTGIFGGGAVGGQVVSKAYGDNEKKAGEALLQRIYEKQAGIGSTILNAGKSMGKAIIGDAKALPGQVKNVGSAFKANGGGVKGLTNPGTVSTMKSVVKNKALLTGAGVVGAGVLAGRSSKQ